VKRLRTRLKEQRRHDAVHLPDGGPLVSSPAWKTLIHNFNRLSMRKSYIPYHLSVCFQPWDHTISADFMQFKIKYLVSLSEALTLRFPKLIGDKSYILRFLSR